MQSQLANTFAFGVDSKCIKEFFTQIECFLIELGNH